jgi:hypothetical protein
VAHCNAGRGSNIDRLGNPAAASDGRIVGLTVPGSNMSHVDNPDRAPPDNMGCELGGGSMDKVLAFKVLGESITVRGFVRPSNVRRVARRALVVTQGGRIDTALLSFLQGPAG